MNIIEICNERFALQQEYLGKKKKVNAFVPLVSIAVATYQHAPYIQDCLNGILIQNTSFPFEIILGEDGSTDGTREICIDYAEKYPNKIRLFLRDRALSQLSDQNGNLITRFNSYWNRLSARGKYIAWCDGDDYWIDANKLQKQVNFLEENEDCVIAFHDAKIVDKDNNVISYSCLNNRINNYSKNEMLAGPHIPTNTAIFRNIIDDYPEFFIKSPNQDILLWHLLGFYGSGKFIRNISSSAYRQHDGGVWSSLNTSEKKGKIIGKRKLIRINLVNNFGKSHKSVKILKKLLRRARIYIYLHKIPVVGNLIIYIYEYLRTNIVMNGKYFSNRSQ